MTPGRTLVLLSMLLVQACATAPGGATEEEPTGILVEGLVIRNELFHDVTDVMIEVPATGAFAGCGNIIAKTRCSTTFREVDYRANVLNLYWRERGVPQELTDFTVAVPASIRAGDETWLEVIIFAPGQAGVRLTKTD